MSSLAALKNWERLNPWRFSWGEAAARAERRVTVRR
jgi:hypothetical protein